MKGRDLLYPLDALEHALRLDEACFYSLHNSPYAPHRLGSAVDVYFPELEALMVFEEARVLEVRRIEAPRLRSDAEGCDYLLILLLDSMHAAKVLHVEPGVRIGEKLVYGDPLGRIIVSGFLYPWSEPHVHLEVRPLWDRYRARGGLKLALARHRWVPAMSIGELRGRVVEVREHYLLLEPAKPRGEGPTPLAVGSAFLEGGYPHYGYAALLSAGSEGEPVGAYSAQLVEPPSSLDQRLRAALRKGFKGVATYIGRREVKLVLQDPAARELREGDELDLTAPT